MAQVVSDEFPCLLRSSEGEFIPNLGEYFLDSVYPVNYGESAADHLQGFMINAYPLGLVDIDEDLCLISSIDKIMKVPWR